MILKKHFVLFGIMLCSLAPVNSMATELSDLGLYVIPYPQKVDVSGDNFNFINSVNIVLDKDHSHADEFAAGELIRDLKNEWNIDAVIARQPGINSIVLSRQKIPSNIGK